MTARPRHTDHEYDRASACRGQRRNRAAARPRAALHRRCDPVTVEHAECPGALSYEYGTFVGAFMRSGTAREATARYVSVWRKDRDGTWRKRLDSWW